jgi:hypothetical protein
LVIKTAALQLIVLKLHGSRRAQGEIKVTDGAKRRRLRRSLILDFNFSLRCGSACSLREIPAAAGTMTEAEPHLYFRRARHY